MNNIFLSGDPLLQGGPTVADYQQKLEQLKQLQQDMEQTMQAVGSGPAQAPVWDEIDKFMNDLSEREFEFVSAGKEFQESQQRIASILQMEYMRMMRPVVERSKDGRAALESHLQLVRRLKKEASREADKDMMLWKEYTEKYSDMTYKDFIKQKGKKR
jgi:hypothetical protein